MATIRAISGGVTEQFGREEGGYGGGFCEEMSSNRIAITGVNALNHPSCMVVTVKVRCLLIAGVLLTAFHGEAAVTITPASPTSADAIFAVIDVAAGCGDIVSTALTGNYIRTDILQIGCVLGPPASTIPETVRFGPLGPGAYAYDVYLDYEHTGPVLYSRQTIVVVPSIPTMSDVGLSILAMSLAAVACFALGRRG